MQKSCALLFHAKISAPIMDNMKGDYIMKLLKTNKLKELSGEKLAGIGMAMGIASAVTMIASSAVNMINGNIQNEVTYREFKGRLIEDGFVKENQNIKS